MTPNEVLDFYIGPLDPQGLATPEQAQRWWRKDAAYDAEIKRRAEPTWHAIVNGEREDWLREPRSLLAYVIVLDQFSRNMFRGEARAFAADPQALRAAISGIDARHDRALIGHERVFLYMPLMHSEELAVQERCVELFSQFRDESSGKLREVLDGNCDFARQHRDVIARWGRFPHRNATLGRPSTPEEIEFLKQPGSSF
jgi:uncharacterized protein (DUF924 family)